MLFVDISAIIYSSMPDRLIPVLVEPAVEVKEPLANYIYGDTVNCGNCPALCCREGMSMPLDNEERVFLEEQGTELELGDEEIQAAHEPGIITKLATAISRSDLPQAYVLKSDCGNLTETPEGPRCAAFEDPRRPKICGGFAVKSSWCRGLRASSGVDPQEYFSVWFDRQAVR